jgi:uncharacterized membrane protein YedE/YeeE
MSILVAALAAGALFGMGLAVSEMINPARVLGFLDVLGRWDPTLLFVMGGALAVTVVGFAWVSRRGRPLFAERFYWPTRTDIDLPLVAGSVVFGIGWGLAGFCPGPAIAALASLSPPVFTFVGAMVAGQWLAARFER